MMPSLRKGLGHEAVRAIVVTVLVGGFLATVLGISLTRARDVGFHSGSSAPMKPQLQGVDGAVLSRLGVDLQAPDGHGVAMVDEGAAGATALAGRAGWVLVSQPVLAWVNQPAYHVSPTCLCWVVHVRSPQPLPAHGPPGSGASLGSTLLQFIDARTGHPAFVLAGGGLG